MKIILKGILPSNWTPDGKIESINTTKIFVEIQESGIKNLIGSQTSEIRYDGEVSKVSALVGKQVTLQYMPNGKYQKLVDILAV